VGSLANTLHIIATAVTVLLILLIIGFGATADGKWFRLYAYATILLLIVTGAWAFLDIPGIAANLPTPWLGVRAHQYLRLHALAADVGQRPLACPSDHSRRQADCQPRSASAHAPLTSRRKKET
jgi:hypothetical protein